MNIRLKTTARRSQPVDDRVEGEHSDALVHRGRSMDANRDVALRDAALSLLSEIGYDRLTIDAVAARARASKATIYRRWPNKAALVVDALHCSKGELLTPDTGSLVGDLETLAKASTTKESRSDASLMLGLITALAHDAELREVFRERIMDPRTSQMRLVFERAVERGEVSVERNLDLLTNLFPAIMIQRVLTTGVLPGPHFAAQVMNDVILPLATAQHVSPTLASTDPKETR